MAKALGVFKSLIKAAEVDDEIAEAVDADLADIALETESEIKELTPVVTGDLKSSFVARKVGFLEHEVATNIHYASYVEYGSEQHDVNFAPRAMMRRGAAVVEKQGLKLFRRANRLK